MTPEQIEQLKETLSQAKTSIEEVEQMIADLKACSSEISKKYLGAAVKKQATLIVSTLKTIE